MLARGRPSNSSDVVRMTYEPLYAFEIVFNFLVIRRRPKAYGKTITYKCKLRFCRTSGQCRNSAFELLLCYGQLRTDIDHNDLAYPGTCRDPIVILRPAKSFDR